MKDDVFTCCGGIQLSKGERCPICGEGYEDDKENDMIENQVAEDREYRDWLSEASDEEIQADIEQVLSEIDVETGYKCEHGILCSACAALNVYEHNLESPHEVLKEGSGLTCDACHLPLDMSRA